MTEPKEEEILQELQRISRLLVLIAMKDQSQQKDQIAALSRVGLEPKEIADLLGTTPNTVRVALVDIRKKAKTEKGKIRKPSKKAESNDEQATS